LDLPPPPFPVGRGEVVVELDEVALVVAQRVLREVALVLQVLDEIVDVFLQGLPLESAEHGRFGETAADKRGQSFNPRSMAAADRARLDELPFNQLATGALGGEGRGP